jgi:hypothetical protein
MTARSASRSIFKVAAAGAGLAMGAYAAYVAVTWSRYGSASPALDDDADALLDRFMPTYEVAERHHVWVSAPAEITLAAARDQDLFRLPLVRAIFRGRELILRSTPDRQVRPRGLLAEVQSLGWGVLAEIPGREIVVGAVTKPWEANVTFRALPPAQFAPFSEPGYVKIAWTLRADPVGPDESIFRTETRVITNDIESRARFRRYWAFFSPGIVLIRRWSLAPLKAEAERRARDAKAERQAV